jgi:hypothetical protein
VNAPDVPRRGWLLLAAAAIPCVLLLAFCGIAIHEWWLIATRQIAVIPTPRPGDAFAQEVSAASVVPFILGSGALAAMFAFAALRGSRKALITAYAAVGLIAGLAYAARAIASPEGAAVAEAVAWIVMVTFGALVLCMVAGAVYWGRKAALAGESLPRGIGRGVLKGIGNFIILFAITLVVLTVLGGLYIAFAFIAAPSIRDS